MKLISLNTWGGRIFEPLIRYIKQQSATTDIFCFQEMQNTSSTVKQYRHLLRANLLDEVKHILPNFTVFYFPSLSGFDNAPAPVNFDLTTGLAIFIKKNIVVQTHENIFLYKEENFQSLKQDFSNLPTPFQFIGFSKDGKDFFIFNLHGTPFPGDKLDSPQRLSQSEKIRQIITSKIGAKILVGDFNLLPETQSMKIIDKDLHNLITEYKIDRTRSNLSPFFGKPDFQKHADYVLVSSDVKVLSFEAPLVEISDHLPMILEFA